MAQPNTPGDGPASGDEQQLDISSEDQILGVGQVPTGAMPSGGQRAPETLDADDYTAIEREAKDLWALRAKQVSPALSLRDPYNPQPLASFEAFQDLPIREKQRTVTYELIALMDIQPRFYQMLEMRALYSMHSLGGGGGQINAEVSIYWANLRRQLPVILDAWSLGKPRHAGTTPATTTTTTTSGGGIGHHQVSLEITVARCLIAIIDYCELPWSDLERFVRSVILAGGAAQALAHLICNITPVATRVAGILLDVFPFLPQVHKAAVMAVFTECLPIVGLDLRIRLLQALQSRRVLPQCYLTAVSNMLDSKSTRDVAMLLLGSAFRKGSLEWFKPTSILTKGVPLGDISATLWPKLCDIISHQMGTSNDVTGVAALLSLPAANNIDETLKTVCGYFGYLSVPISPADLEQLWTLGTSAATPYRQRLCAVLFLVMACAIRDLTNDVLTAQLTRLSKSSFGNFFVFITAYLRTNDMQALEDMVSGMLGMDFTLPQDRLFMLKDAICEPDSPYNDSVLARKLLEFPVAAAGGNNDYDINNSGSNSSRSALSFDGPDGHKVLRCVLRFIQNGIFQRSGINLQAWFVAIMLSPHPDSMAYYIQLIKSYVSACFSSPCITPIPESVLHRIFSPYLEPTNGPVAKEMPGATPPQDRQADDDSVRVVTPSQILGLLYVLYYNDQLMSSGSSSGQRESRGKACGEYTDAFTDTLPVGHILKYIEQGPELHHYQGVWSELLSLAVAQYPDQMNPATMMTESFSASSLKSLLFKKGNAHWRRWQDGNARPRKSASELPSLAVSQGLGDASRELEGVLYKYSSLPLSIQLRHASALIRAVVPRLFALSPTGSVHELFLKVWDRLHSIMPRHISACTVNSMRSADEQTKSELTVQDLWLDPLVIFRCDRRVFDHPPLTKLFLGIVREFLAISWVKYRLICTLGQRRHDLATPKFGSTNASALVQLQEAASIQMVLEIASAARSEVTRKHLFQYIHSRFLDYRLMPKLLHFQTYDVALIPQMVERVPSMHMCYEFIPELLSQPRFSQQMFALRVAVHIFRKYPLRKGLEITKGAIFQYFERYLSNKATPAMVAHQLEFSIVMIQTVGAVVRLFPEVEEYALYVIQLLVEFNRGIDGSPDAEDEQGYGGGGTARDRCTEWKRQVQSMLIDLRSMLTEGGFRLFRDLDVIVCTPGSRSGGNGSANSGGQKRNVPLSDQATEYLKDGGTLAKANGKPPQVSSGKGAGGNMEIEWPERPPQQARQQPQPQPQPQPQQQQQQYQQQARVEMGQGTRRPLPMQLPPGQQGVVGQGRPVGSGGNIGINNGLFSMYGLGDQGFTNQMLMPQPPPGHALSHHMVHDGGGRGRGGYRGRPRRGGGVAGAHHPGGDTPQAHHQSKASGGRGGGQGQRRRRQQQHQQQQQ